MTTPVVARFGWSDGIAGRLLRCDALDGLARHAFTTRQLEFRPESFDDDSRRLAKAFELEADRLVWVKQVHGRAVLVVERDTVVDSRPEADAIVSADPGRLIAVRVADCVPILMADRRRRAVAAVHAGWRGTCAGVVGAAVTAMSRFGVEPTDLVAAFGPSIGSCCYQVGEKVRAAFLSVTPDSAAWFAEDGPGRWRLDLWKANADQLEWLGVKGADIHQSRVCTADHLDICFSYRREGESTGRMVGAIRT